jgi:hypothetical protein
MKTNNILNWFKDKVMPKYNLNQKEELILSITKHLCEQPDTEITMAPITGRHYIVNKRLEYWMKVSEDSITITNHKFTYSNTSPQTFQYMVIAIVQSTIEKHRTNFEINVFQNEIELLNNIVSNITK